MRFDDKYIDYKSKSKRELYENLILFNLLSKPKLVSIGKYILKIWKSLTTISLYPNEPNINSLPQKLSSRYLKIITSSYTQV